MLCQFLIYNKMIQLYRYLFSYSNSLSYNYYLTTCWLLSCLQFFATLWTVAHQALLSMRFSMQEYWSRLLFPSPGDRPD